MKIKESKAMEKIPKIRERIYEETKGMNDKERSEWIHREAFSLDMANTEEVKALREVWEWKNAVYEETKGMKKDEVIKHFQRETDRFLENGL